LTRKDRSNCLLLVWLLTGLCTAGLSAQTENEFIELVDADSLVDISTPSEEIFELWGNVKMKQGEALLYCQEARWYKSTRNIHLKRDVMIYDGERTLVADRIFYNGRTKTEYANGHVVLTEADKALFCEKMEYRQETRTAIALENIYFKDFLENRVLTCDSLIWERNRRYVSAALNPVIIQVDSTGTTTDTLSISGDLIEAWEDSQRARVSRNVRMSKGVMSARCALADYDIAQDELILKLDPSVDYESHTMRGDTIIVNLQDMKLQGAYLNGNPVIVTRDSTADNTLSGKRITIVARNDTLLSMVVYEQAKSRYHILEEGEEPHFNTVTGDLITVYFKENQVDRVVVNSTPGQCTGKYAPLAAVKQTGESAEEKHGVRERVRERR
jgi:lipopolysaccharide export system protein LptA